MSNEKLGAEQGRVTPKGAENVCPVCYHDFADCPCPFEVKPAEQAYHARGAAAIREAAEIIEEVYQDLDALRGISPATYNRIIKWRRCTGRVRTCHCGTPSEPHNESVHEEAWAEHILKMATTRREPGADTVENNRNDTMEYWRARAITAEQKVLEFHAQIAQLPGVGREQSWSRVEDGLPTEYGNYLVVRENADLHDVTVAVTSFHPRGVPPWFDKGFNYLYWIGPIAIPKELPMVGHWTRKRFEERMHETE